jgi:hypothetical protein
MCTSIGRVHGVSGRRVISGSNIDICRRIECLPTVLLIYILNSFSVLPLSHQIFSFKKTFISTPISINECDVDINLA